MITSDFEDGFIPTPMTMGKNAKDVPTDWSQFETRAMERLGYVPKRHKALTPKELKELGFVEAATELQFDRSYKEN